MPVVGREHHRLDDTEEGEGASPASPRRRPQVRRLVSPELGIMGRQAHGGGDGVDSSPRDCLHGIVPG
jgi:hypothetical protein